MNPQVSIPKEALAAFCRTHGIRRLSIFGSGVAEEDRMLAPDHAPGSSTGHAGAGPLPE